MLNCPTMKQTQATLPLHPTGSDGPKAGLYRWLKVKAQPLPQQMAGKNIKLADTFVG